MLIFIINILETMPEMQEVASLKQHLSTVEQKLLVAERKASINHAKYRTWYAATWQFDEPDLTHPHILVYTIS